MNVWSVAALGIGSMVGAGIFALLGQAALVAGADTYLAFCIGGVIALLSGYSFACLATRYPKAGGITEYFDEGFGVGPLAGTLSLIYLLTLIGSVAMVAKAFGAYAAPLCFGASDRVVVDVFASGSVVAFFLLNVRESKLVGLADLRYVSAVLVKMNAEMFSKAEERPSASGAHSNRTRCAFDLGLYGFHGRYRHEAGTDGRQPAQGGIAGA